MHPISSRQKTMSLSPTYKTLKPLLAGGKYIMVNTGYVCPGAVELLLSQSGD